jgi:predicted HicB family RNase H-like nuclease
MKRPSLASSMKALKESTESAAPAPYHAATRDGMKRLLIPVAPALHKRIKIRAAEQEMTIEALARAALEAYLSQQ